MKKLIGTIVILAVAGGTWYAFNTGTSVHYDDAMGVMIDGVKEKNTLLILDSSGSMNQTLDGEKKLDIMKAAVGSLIAKKSPDTELGALVYGQAGSNSEADKALSCATIDELAPFASTVNIDVTSLVANGWTPIAKALERAQTILADYPDHDNEVLLVSDGEETCGGDPVAVAKMLCAAGVRVDVIGLDVSGTAAEELKEVSRAGCGAYASVTNGEQFSALVQGQDLRVVAPGAIVNIIDGNLDVTTDDAKVHLNDGSLDVMTDDGTHVTRNPDGTYTVDTVEAEDF